MNGAAQKPLLDRMREAAAGRPTWYVMNPERSAYVISFSRWGCEAVLDPEREAHRWLEEHQRDYPERFKGYVVERDEVKSEAQRLLDEAAELLEVSDELRYAASFTRDDLGPDEGARNYPHVRGLLAFVERVIEASSGPSAPETVGGVPLPLVAKIATQFAEVLDQDLLEVVRQSAQYPAVEPAAPQGETTRKEPPDSEQPDADR